MENFEASPVPPWATEQTGPPDDFLPIEGQIRLEPVALSLTPDAFRWHLEQEIEGLRRDLMRAYYNQRSG